MYWITAIGGLALIAAPYGLGYSNSPSALWASLVLGAIVVLASAYKIGDKGAGNWEYWVVGIAGLLAVIAPFVLGFSALAAATWTTVILGAVVAVLAGYEVLFVRPQTP